jgi:hypothetical protein
LGRKRSICFFNESIAGLQLVNKDFEYKVVDELSSFDWLNFKKEEDQTIMMYSFTGKSIATLEQNY